MFYIELPEILNKVCFAKYGTSEAYRNKKVLVLKNIRQNILCRNTMLNQGLKLGFNNLQAKLKERLVNLWNLKAKNPFWFFSRE